MVSDSALSRLCALSYDGSVSWDYLWQGDPAGGIWAAIKRLPEADILVFRGSVTPEDWFRDLKGNPYPHPILGNVEYGFQEGLDGLYPQIADVIGQHPIITGHSLGAARACLFGALLQSVGRAPAAIVTFGCPRPGYARLAEILNPVSVRLYKNEHDLVTDIPVWFPDFPYQHVREEIEIHIPPRDFGILCEHHIDLYQRGVDSLLEG